ncbi:MAG: hypothetical protein JXR59_02155 [Desulfuromonadaceae bacterium]|nr:hypothetical protein [Desulfuromonadaceae bacterium]
MTRWCLRGLLVFGLLTGPGWAVSEPDETLNTEIASVEERRLLAQLKENQLKQQDQLKVLEKREMELNLLQAEVDKKLDRLQRLREEIQQLLAEKDAREQEKVSELSQMYNKMPAEQAALILQGLDQPLAVEILAGMKAKSAGKVLAAMGGEKAADLSKAYSTLKKD